MDFYSFKYSPDLENLSLVNNWTNVLPVLFFFDGLLTLHFFTRCLYFHYYWWSERGKNQFFKCFWRILLKFEEKILEIHKQSWLLITWILKKSNSMQTLVEDIPKIKLSHWFLSKTYTFNTWNSHCLEQILCFILIITLSLIRWFWLSYWETTVAAPNFSLAIYILFISLGLDYRFTSTQNSQWDFCTVEQKATIFLLPWSNFEIKL